MSDGQWRLLYPGVDYAFGTVATPCYFASAPDIGDVEVRSEDAPRPRQDGVAFGVDFRGARTITFDMGVFGSDETEAYDALDELSGVWRADAIRGQAGAMAELQIERDGKTRSVFGRPRRFAPNHGPIKDGIALVVADFACADDLFYGPAEAGVTLGITPPLGGGLVAPLATPLASTASSDRSTGITVGGKLPTWPVITFQGPVTNPTLEIVGLWKMSLATTLAFDQSVTIDTAPWARTVLRNGTASLAGAFTRDSVRLANAAIPPGSYEVVLRGTSEGTASVSLSWRVAYPSL